MKKLTMAALVLMMSASAFATKYTAEIVKIVNDQGEGTKIMLNLGGGAKVYASHNKPATGGMTYDSIMEVALSAVKHEAPSEDELQTGDIGKITASKMVTIETEAKSNVIYTIRLSNK